jgi:hypothetical protein
MAASVPLVKINILTQHQRQSLRRNDRVILQAYLVELQKYKGALDVFRRCRQLRHLYLCRLKLLLRLLCS